LIKIQRNEALLQFWCCEMRAAWACGKWTK